MDSVIFSFILLAAIFTAIAISFVAMPAIIKIASLKKLMDEPDEDRKFHKKVVPTLGGIGIFASFLISFSIWGKAGTLESYPFFVAAIFMLFLIGIKDDILVLSPLKKLLVQIFAALEIVIGGGIVLTDLGGVFGFHQIPWVTGVILSTFIFIVIINAYNLIDGIDGLAGGIGLVISAVLGSWFLFAGFNTLAVLAFVLVGALVGFLVFNFHPAKIFMGDTGAMAVGFILTYIVMQFILVNQANIASAFHINNASVLAVALLIIPVVDTSRIFVLRVVSGKNPLMADGNHIHHQLIKEGISPGVASPALWVANLGVILLAYSLDFLDPNILLIIVLAAGYSILPFIKLVYSLLLKYMPSNYAKIISKPN